MTWFRATIALLGLAACADSLALATAAPDGGTTTPIVDGGGPITPPTPAGSDGSTGFDGNVSGDPPDAGLTTSPCVDPSTIWMDPPAGWLGYDAGAETIANKAIAFPATRVGVLMHPLTTTCSYTIQTAINFTDDPSTYNLTFFELGDANGTSVSLRAVDSNHIEIDENKGPVSGWCTSSASLAAGTFVELGITIQSTGVQFTLDGAPCEATISGTGFAFRVLTIGAVTASPAATSLSVRFESFISTGTAAAQ